MVIARTKVATAAECYTGGWASLSLFAGYIRDGAAGALPAFNEPGGGQPLKRTPGVRARAINEFADVLDRMVHPGVLKERRKHLLGRWTKLGIRHDCATFTQTG